MKRLRAYVLPIAVIGTLALIASLLWRPWPRHTTAWVQGTAQG